MDMNTLFNQAVSDLEAKGYKSDVKPDSPENGGPVYSFDQNNSQSTPASDSAGKGYGLMDSAVDSAVGMYKGLGAGSAGLGESFGGGLEWLGHRIDSDSIADAGKSISSYYKPLRESFAPPKHLQGSVMDDPSLLARGDWWTYQLGNLAPSLGAAMIPGAAVGKAVQIGGEAVSLTPKVIERLARVGQAIGAGVGGGAMEGTSTYHEVLQKGGSEKEAARAGEMMALASSALNALSFERMFSKAGSGLAAKATKHITSGVVEGLSEWAEEPAESISKDLAHYITTGEMKPGVIDRAKQAARDGVNVIGPAALTGFGGSIMSGSAGLSEEEHVSDKEMIANIEHVKQGMPVDLLDGEESVQPEKAAAVDTRTPAQKMRDFYRNQEKVLGKEPLKGFGLKDLIDSDHKSPEGMADLKADIQERYRFKPEPELEQRIDREMAMRQGWRPASFEDSSSLSPSQEPEVLAPFERSDLFRSAQAEVVSNPKFNPQTQETEYLNNGSKNSFEDAWDIAIRELEEGEAVQSEGVVSDPAQADPVEASGQQAVLTASRLDALPSSRLDAQASENETLPKKSLNNIFDIAVQELGHESAFNHDPETALYNLPDEQLKEVGNKLGVRQGKKSKIGFIESFPGGIAEKRDAYLSVVKSDSGKLDALPSSRPDAMPSKRQDSIKQEPRQEEEFDNVGVPESPAVIPNENFDNSFSEGIKANKEINKDVSSPSIYLEPDSSDSGSQNQLGNGIVSGQSGTSGSSDSGNGERSGETGVLEQDDNVLHADPSSIVGTGSDNSLSGKERQVGTAERTSGTVESGRSNRADDYGESPDSGAAGTAQESEAGLSGELSGRVGSSLRKISANQHLPLADKVRLQQEADSSTQVHPEDLSNIRETLPVLFPEQHEDVYKAEQRFFRH